jgi:hypothetical protein
LFGLVQYIKTCRGHIHVVAAIVVVVAKRHVLVMPGFSVEIKSYSLLLTTADHEVVWDSFNMLPPYFSLLYFSRPLGRIDFFLSSHMEHWSKYLQCQGSSMTFLIWRCERCCIIWHKIDSIKANLQFSISSINVTGLFFTEICLL